MENDLDQQCPNVNAMVLVITLDVLMLLKKFRCPLCSLSLQEVMWVYQNAVVYALILFSYVVTLKKLKKNNANVI